MIVASLALEVGCTGNPPPTPETAATSLSIARLTPSVSNVVGAKSTAELSTTTVQSPLQTQVTILGVQLNDVRQDVELHALRESGAAWYRGLTIPWSRVESEPGVRNWDVLADFERDLLTLQEYHVIPIVSVTSTPAWAEAMPGYSCGLILPEKINDFVSFMGDLVKRYSQPPFELRYWEIWNEPDIDPGLVAGDSPFGCWGDINDPYYGGQRYSKLLSAVYPEVKKVDPQAQVLVGGLLMDCDPNHPPEQASATNPGCVSSKFMEGILIDSQGKNFDGVSFHAYDYYRDTFGGSYSNANWASDNSSGPVLVAKATYLRQLLEQFGAVDKYLINSELALLCQICDPGTPLFANFEQTKADYALISFVAAKTQRLRANIWYSMLGWRNSGLIDENGAPRLVFHVFQFANQILGPATYIREVIGLGGVRAYEFQVGKNIIWVAWSPDNSPQEIGLPSLPEAVFSMVGDSLPASRQITLGKDPVYIEWSQ